MKSPITLVLLSSTLTFVLFSCGKSNTGAKPNSGISDSTSPATTVLNLNLTTTVANEEVIISDTGGVVLLDTMSPYPSPLIATLKTAHHLLDVSLITYDTTRSTYSVGIFKAVDPSQWSTLEGTSYYGIPYQPLSLPTALTPIVYKNMPAVPTDDGVICSDYAGGYIAALTAGPSGILSGAYREYTPNNYTYLLLPQGGLYNFHIPPANGPDTVDLSHMDTATMVNFALPSDYMISSEVLTGLTDTTDLSKSVFLYLSNGLPMPANLEYPHTVVQLMQFNLTAKNSDGTAYYYSCGETIPSTLSIPFPELSSYSITASQPTNFSITFSAVSPAYYYTQWSNATIGLSLYAPGDSTSLDPQAIMTALKSKLLQGQSMSGFQLGTLDFTSLTGLTYNALINLEHNPTLLKTQHVPASIEFYKSF